MIFGLLFLRLVLGVILVAHGAQKLFGIWGGGGPQGTAGFMGSLGMRWPYAMGLMAGFCEFAAGLLFIAGFLTPLAALMAATVMFTAIFTVHRKAGFFNSDGGYEFNALIIAAAVALAGIGPGQESFDAYLELDASNYMQGSEVALAVLALAFIAGLMNVTLGRKRDAKPHATPDTPPVDNS